MKLTIKSKPKQFDCEDFILSTMERHGCFVYHVEGDAPVPVRSQASPKDDFLTGASFAPGELVSVDLIRRIGKADLLRLAGGAGWLLQEEDNLKSLYVESELFTLVVDHFPAGLTARSHPNEGDNFRMDSVSFLPLEKIYCDKRVTHPETGCAFYRLQGTNHWVFDRKFDPERKIFEPTLLDEHHVTPGVFAYVALGNIPIRTIPTMNQDFKTGLDIHKGELIMVKVIRDSPQGPWLKLACGSGWVPEASGRRSNFEQVNIEESIWSFRVLNHPIGIQLRSHPMDDRDEKLVPQKSFEDRQKIDFAKLPILIQPDNIIDCDMRITSPTTGISWYHVVDTKGWVFDRRNGKPTLEPYKKSTRRLKAITSTNWTPEYIRGMATMIDGLEEVRHNDVDHVILFQKGELELKIWYKIRTATVYVDRPKKGRVQVSRKDCSKDDLIQILKDPKHLLSEGQTADALHPTSPRGAADFDRHTRTRRAEDEEEPDSPTFDKARQNRTALMKYGARYHRPQIPHIRSRDESQVAIKGRRNHDAQQRSEETGRSVRNSSDLSTNGSIATGREIARRARRPRRDGPILDDIRIICDEDELDSRHDLLVLEEEILLLLDGKQRLIEGLRTCELRRSDEAHNLQLQSEAVVKKLEPLVDPGLAFWGTGFGTWRCDKCKEDCSDRHSLSQHVAATGH